MKKYPHTDSTDLIIYSQKPKKEKKPRVWLAALSSALAASVFTAGVFGAGLYYYNKNNPAAMQLASGTKSLVTADNTNTEAQPQLALNTNGKKILSTVEIANQVGPSVVGVINKTKVQPQQYYDPFTGRRYYYTDPNQSDETVEQGSGSGIIIRKEGYIVTNQHVIDGATEISVILNTGEEYTATLVGQDSKTDIAVLKIDPGNKELTVATLGDSTTVQVGEKAVAIGNPLGQEFYGSVTQGIISAVNRTMSLDGRNYNLLQTDAAINAGNSGGALINEYGEVIGINSVKLSSTGIEGMSFAIAISEVVPIIDSLIESGHVSRPFVGIGIEETNYGLFISSVTKGSGAEKAGLQVNDMILEVEGQKVEKRDDVNSIRDTKKIGDTLTFKIVRNGATLEIPVTLTDTIDETSDNTNQNQNQNQQEQSGQNQFGGSDWQDFFDSFFNW